MADARDDRVSAAYREMPGEGPSASIDAAIQAAARRAAGSRPAAGRRWQKPLSIAAVLALAIALTLQVEREKSVVVDGTPVSAGSAEYPVPQAEVEVRKEEPRAVAKEAAPVPETKRFTPDPPRAEPAASASRPAPAVAQPAPPPASPPAPMLAPAPAPVPAPAPAAIAPPPAAAGAGISADAVRAAPQAAKRMKAEMAREATVQEKTMSGMLDTPERRLERIADLRAKGLHDEADRELVEFRRAFPDFRLSDDWRRRIER